LWFSDAGHRPRLAAAMIFDRLRIIVIFSKRLDRTA